MSFTIDILFYTPFVFILLYLLTNWLAKTPRNICIIVLGDIGRSPRMQYHALSFAKEGFRVYFVGYKGSQPLKTILENENIQLFHVPEPPSFLSYFPRLAQYGLKVIWQSLTLAWTLLLLPKSSSVLLQNPPSIPTMLVSYIICCVRRSELVIDWHNYGHTILSMALGKKHPLVSFALWYEKKCARFSSYNLCVTNAMKDDLQQNWNVGSIAVHDRPPDIFKSINLVQKHDLLERLSAKYPVFGSSENQCTRLTEREASGKVVELKGRPALLVSSTSWTEDEDFCILLEALTEYDKTEACDKLPNLICVITGKGPQKQFYSKKIEQQKWKKVEFCLPWLEAEDYPRLLASADIGVCLHTSSSGLDLPMKVVDMFGCGLPVCAANFNCIDELVQHERNGLVFNSSQELQQQLKSLLTGFPEAGKQLAKYRTNLEKFQETRWHDQWKKLVLPIFQVIGGLDTAPYSFPGFTRQEDWQAWGDAAHIQGEKDGQSVDGKKDR